MPARGKGHPNSSSAWGHDPDVDSFYNWSPTRVVTGEDIDPDRYDAVEDGQVRVYLVAVKTGQWICTGLAPSSDRMLGLYATADGAWALERVVCPSQGQKLPHAVSVTLGELTAVPEDSARRWSEIIEEVHER